MRVTTRLRVAAILAGGPATVAATVALAVPAAARSAPPPVSVLVETAGTAAPTYRIAVRNDTDRPVATTVRQDLPRGAPPTAVSAGGEVRPAVAGDRSAPTEVTWQVLLPARGMTMLSTTLAARPPGGVVTAPTCAFADVGTQPYDCASATWVAPGRPAGHGGPPPWRRESVLVPSAAIVLVAVAAGLVVQRERRRYAQARRPSGVEGDGSAPRSGTSAAPPSSPPSTGTSGPARGSAPSTGPGRARPARPQWGVRRPKPATVLVVLLAVALLTVTLALTGWTGSAKVAGMNPNARPTNGAWLGRTATGMLGARLRDAAFEFTVYRLVCGAASAGPTRTCLAIVDLRNFSGTEQNWFAGMQRIYLPSGNWVSADDVSTRAANRGQDPFAGPVPPGGSRLVAVAFPVPAREQPVRIELRSGAFSAGVSVAL